VKAATLSPVWNEHWKVKNVPEHATLSVEVMDKDDGTPTDDYIGKFTTSVTAGTKEAEIEGPLLHRSRGTFWLKVRVWFISYTLTLNLNRTDRAFTLYESQRTSVPI
jgi:hypothetical protein